MFPQRRGRALSGPFASPLPLPLQRASPVAKSNAVPCGTADSGSSSDTKTGRPFFLAPTSPLLPPELRLSERARCGLHGLRPAAGLRYDGSRTHALLQRPIRRADGNGPPSMADGNPLCAAVELRGTLSGFTPTSAGRQTFCALPPGLRTGRPPAGGQGDR